jgi:hypothetical protein
MAIDEVDEKSLQKDEGSDHKVTFIALFVALALLAIGEIYSLNTLGAMRQSFQTDQAATKQQLTAQMDDRLTALEQSNARVLEALKEQVEAAYKRTGATQTDLHRARALVKKLQQAQAKDAAELKQEIARKADQEQVGALSAASLELSSPATTMTSCTCASSASATITSSP